MSLSTEEITDYIKRTDNKLSQEQIKKYFSLFHYFSQNKDTLTKKRLLSKINEIITAKDFILLAIKENIQIFPGEELLFIDFLRLFTYGYYEDTKEALFEPIFNQLYISCLEDKSKLTLISLIKQLTKFYSKIRQEDITELFQKLNLKSEIDFKTFLNSIKNTY